MEKEAETSGNAARCTKQRSKQRYAKKRRFHGKKKSEVVPPVEVQVPVVEVPVEYSENEEELVVPVECSVHSTVSVSKVVDIEETATDSSGISGYRLMDTAILNSIFNCLSCPACFTCERLSLEDIAAKKKGLARYLGLRCVECGYSRHFYSSKTVETNKPGKKLLDINVRMVYGMRGIGAGHSALVKLCGYLNMPEPMTQNNFDKLLKTIGNCTKVVAERSMVEAAKEIKGEVDVIDTAVSVDGTWQRRGFTSLNGIVTAISVDTGKILDCEIMSRNCKACNLMEAVKRDDPIRCDIWHASHNCKLNYRGSAPNMEKIGAIKIFGRSIAKHGMYYTSFYGDGDSKSYSAVQKIYGDDKLVIKYECIGHYQKRVGNRLRKKRKAEKLGGNGRLTNAKVDTLQNYFGIALRQNIGSLDKMRKAIMASLCHVSER